jgi:hypothetical protein
MCLDCHATPTDGLRHVCSRFGNQSTAVSWTEFQIRSNILNSRRVINNASNNDVERVRDVPEADTLQ